VPFSPTEPESVISVAVPVPGLGLLRYRAPRDGPRPPKGARVLVPLGSRTVTGCVVDPAAEAPPDTSIKDIVSVLDDEPFLPATVVDLALWVGDYYASGPGDALAVAMPPASRRGRRTTFKTVQVAELAASEVSPARPLGPKQRLALDRLRERAEGLTLPELLRTGVSTATVRSLARAGHISLRAQVVDRDPFGSSDAATPDGPWSFSSPDHSSRALTMEQEEAFGRLAGMAAAGAYRPVLLHGVTGSGKTELYLRLASAVVQAGRRALMLVPEIALTPAVAGSFRARFGSRVAIQHSALGEGERHDQWHRIRRGDVDVVVGTRSAVFTPLESIGLIVVDEEHEASYKQEEAPRYHGRDVAVMRARMEGALVVLGSATPSLESAANARSGRYAVVRLTKRILNRPLAAVRIVDMRPEYAAHGPDVRFSGALVEAIGDRLARGEQTLVLLNRRGFATVIFCRGCGASLECPHCSVALTYYRGARRVRCHYCNYSGPVPRACGLCGGTYLEQSGFGTERLEAELRQIFPGARTVRVDRDTIRRRGAIARVIADVSRGNIDILIGTQMIAKGHDFPAVTLVGVVSADVGLGLADFRASERAFQLLTQVVGRAGRGETPGEAIIQTLYPDHYAIQAAASQDYQVFFEREMDFRSKLHYPPAFALINVVLRGRALDGVMTDATDLVARVRRQPFGGRVLGPAPAALAKIKDEYRVQFFIKGRQRKPMRDALEAALAERPDLKRRTIVDVDPVSVL
jgi:primosomal protein N' (replication factor Y) (superfamily II helicase)